MTAKEGPPSLLPCICDIRPLTASSSESSIQSTPYMALLCLVCDDSLPGPDDPLRTVSGGFGKWLDLCPAYLLRSHHSDLSYTDLSIVMHVLRTNADLTY